MARKTTIKIDASEESFSQAKDFVEGALNERRVTADNASEAMMLFEALFHKIVPQVKGEDAQLEISGDRELGHTDIEITYPGERYSVPEEGDSSDPDANTIKTLSDKLSCSYEAGYNTLTISVSKSALAPILPSLVAIVAAVVASFILRLVLDDASQDFLVKECIAPLEKLFTNAMLMIGAPMTLFSLLRNVTNAFIVSERHSSARTVFVSTMTSSVSAIVLAFIMGFLFVQWALSAIGMTESIDIGLANWSLSSAVDQIIPSSIIQPFETISPIPMIVVALLMALALKSIGPNFNKVKNAIDAFYDLFSGILQIVMIVFPLACFLLFLEVLLTKDGAVQFLDILFIAVLVFASTIPLLALYALRLKLRGVRICEFVKRLLPLVRENFAMGSVIDAVPYNTRYCVKNFGISRERLEKELPLLAQISLDGNCFILMLLASIYILVANCGVTWIHIVVIAFIVLFLSFGAPNQPGSILIGMLVILTYLNSDSIISLALAFELFFGGLQNILNVISGIAMVAENECRETKQPLKMP